MTGCLLSMHDQSEFKNESSFDLNSHSSESDNVEQNTYGVLGSILTPE